MNSGQLLEIAEQYGGRMRQESVAGQKTVFAEQLIAQQSVHIGLDAQAE